MTGVAIHFGFDDTPITRHLARLALLDQRGYDGVRREIGEMMLGDIQDNLDGQRLFDGSPMPQSDRALGRTTHWKSSSKKRGYKKGDVREVGKTLIDRHHLYDSYTYRLVPYGVEVGSNMVYAAIHHFGGETGREGHRFTLPPRPVMGLGPAQEQKLGDFLIAEIVKAQR